MTYPAGGYVQAGSDGQIKWGPKEDTYGGALDGSEYYIVDIISEELNEKRERIQYSGIRANKLARKSYPGNRLVQGPGFDFVANVDFLGFPLSNLFGDVTGTAGVSVSPDIFMGTGLNDLTAGGTFSGSQFRIYLIEIDGAGTPDTFKWSVDYGGTYEASTVTITGAAQTLDNGVTVTFGATTGHTLADKWLVIAHKNNSFIFNALGTNTFYSDKVERSWAQMSPQRHLLYEGIKVNGMSFSITPMWDGRITLDLIGRNQDESSPATSPVDSTPTEFTSPWMYGGLSILRAGDIIYRCQQLDMNITSNIESSNYVHDNRNWVLRDAPRRMYDITGTIVVTYEDGDYIDDARANSDIDIGFVTYDSSTVPGMFAGFMQEVNLTEEMEPGVSEGAKTMSFPFTAHYESGDIGTALRFYLENTQAVGLYKHS
jgi:hypothetical protein